MADEGGAIVVGGVHKQFVVGGWRPRRQRPRVDALRGVDLRVEPGSIHGVIGPNGSGKSTLLRVLATLIIPDAGVASVGGFDVVDEPLAVRRQIGFSTGEERSLYWRLTARENLEFTAALHRVDDVDVRIDGALASVDLLDAAERPVNTYSQGMARRLGLARAMLHRPSVLLLDEPTRSLDPEACDELRSTARNLRDAFGTTIVITTHDLDEAALMCDAVSVLRAGRIERTVAPTSAAQLQSELRAVAP